MEVGTVLPRQAQPLPLVVRGAEAKAPPGVDAGVLLQVAACIVPALALVRMGSPILGARVLFALLALFFVYNVARGRPWTNLAFVIGVLPGIMLLRNLVLFHSVNVLLAAALAWVVLRSTRELQRLARARVLPVAYFVLIYWLFSFMHTGAYDSNLRVFEAVFSAAGVVLLASRPRELASALLGVMLCVFAVGAALFSYGTRLGSGEIGGFYLGNPISFGLPLALVLLLLSADGGRWLLLAGRPLARFLLLGAVGSLLLLSTSRGSWLVAAAGLLTIVLLNRRHRHVVIVVAAALGLAAVLAFQSERGAFLQNAVERTFSSDRSAVNRTSGRSDQWLIFPRVMRDAPILGYGPGSGSDVYARYSVQDARVRFHAGGAVTWHSLYQHVAVETGLVGLALMLLLFAVMLRRNLRFWRVSGEVGPLLGTVGFLVIALSVSGMDAASGLYLGLGLVRQESGPDPSVPE